MDQDVSWIPGPASAFAWGSHLNCSPKAAAPVIRMEAASGWKGGRNTVLSAVGGQLPSQNCEVLCFRSTSNNFVAETCSPPPLLSDEAKCLLCFSSSLPIMQMGAINIQFIKTRGKDRRMWRHLPTKMFLEPCEVYGSKLHMRIGRVVSRESS